MSDQYSMLDHAYHTVRDAIHTTGDGKLIGGDSSLSLLGSLPPAWLTAGQRALTLARCRWVRCKQKPSTCTDWPGIHSYEEINDRLFINPGRNDNIHDAPSKAKWNSPVHPHWLSQQQYMWQFVDAQVPPVGITMQQTLPKYYANLRDDQAEIAAQPRAASGRKRWKTKEGVYQLKDPEKLEQALPDTDEATYAEMLRDV